MDNKANLTSLSGATVRLQKVIYLAGALASDSGNYPEDLVEFLEGSTPEQFRELFGEDPGHPDEVDDPVDWLLDTGRLGFLAQAATPVMRPISRLSRSYSWNYYNTHWVYGETIEAVVRSAEAWAATVRESETEKAERQGNQNG